MGLKKTVVVLGGLGGLGFVAWMLLRKKPATVTDDSAARLLAALQQGGPAAQAQAAAVQTAQTSVGINRLFPGGASPTQQAGSVVGGLVSAGVGIGVSILAGSAVGGPVGLVAGAVIAFIITVMPGLLGAFVGSVPGDQTPPVDWLTAEADALYRRDGVVRTKNPAGLAVIVTRWGVFEGEDVILDGTKIYVVKGGTRRLVIDAGGLRNALNSMFPSGAPVIVRKPVPPPAATPHGWMLTSDQARTYIANGGWVAVTVPDGRYNQPAPGTRVVVTPMGIFPGVAAVLSPNPAIAGNFRVTVLDASGRMTSNASFAPTSYTASGVMATSVR